MGKWICSSLFLLFFVVIVSLCILHAKSASKVPKGIAGFEIGKDIDAYVDRIRKDIELVEVDYPYLTAYEILPFPGFRGGFLVVGNCTGSRKVLRVKLKYSNSSEKFFDMLKRGIERRFGKPIEYRGDPFHVFVAWKWRFVDSEGNVVSLILQHYTGSDEEYASGNSIKINYLSAIKAERRCYEKKKKNMLKTNLSRKKPLPNDLDYYLPY